MYIYLIGALTIKPYNFLGRPWEFINYNSVDFLIQWLLILKWKFVVAKLQEYCHVKMILLMILELQIKYVLGLIV